jgi:hypothetical protein
MENPFSILERRLNRLESLLVKQDEKIDTILKSSKDQKNKYLSSAEAKALFVPKISDTTFYRWCKAGLIQKYLIGDKVVFKKEQIESAVKELRVYSNKKGANVENVAPVQ